MTGARSQKWKMNYWLLAVALVGLVIARIGLLLNDINQRIPKKSLHAKRCTRHLSIMAPEDIVPVFTGVFLASSGEMGRFFMKAFGAAKTPMGQIYAIWDVDDPSKDPSVAPLVLEGFPENTAFHPHGLHYRRETGELFVVNHGYTMGGERIDVFKVEQTFAQDPLPEVHPSLRADGSSQTGAGAAGVEKEKSQGAVVAKGLLEGVAPVKIRYSLSVDHEFITSSYGVLNDLVLVNDDELYVTQSMSLPFPSGGPLHAANLMERLRGGASWLLLQTRLARPPILRCTRIRSEDIQCERLAYGYGIMYNGVAVSPDKKRLLVSDSMDMQMLVFNRSLETGALSLHQRIAFPGGPDNLEFDPYRGEEAYTVGLVNPWDYFKYTQVAKGSKDPEIGESVIVGGGASSLIYDKESGMYSNSLEIWCDDSPYSVSSVAATPSGARLLGSSVARGFKLCRAPPCDSGDRDSTETCGWIPPAA